MMFSLPVPSLRRLSSVLLLGCLVSSAGCQSVSRQSIGNATRSSARSAPTQTAADHSAEKSTADPLLLAAFSDDEPSDSSSVSEIEEEDRVSHDVAIQPVAHEKDPSAASATANELPGLESLVQAANPRLRGLLQKANAASMRTRYVDRLPDPTFGANVFGHPIETAAGSQRANLTLMQMIPWLDRLEAQQQQACFEAMALRQQYAAERLKLIRDVRVRYYRLYVLTRQVESVEANQSLLETLIEIVNTRVATGTATQGDVLLGTLELSRLQEQLLTLRQQIRSTKADINRLTDRPAATPVSVPDNLTVEIPQWTHDLLVQTAFARQPVIAAAQLQSNATRWGVDVAKLKRRPDIRVGAAWFLMDDNRPPSTVVDVGRDAWSLGATVSIPLDRTKYDAIRDEALWKHAASSSNLRDTRRQFETTLLDLLEQTRAAADTVDLYRNTIIPQSEQTLAADQESLTDGSVEFDRVIQDFRNLLTLQFGYHRATGELAMGIARIQQAVGMDLQP